MMYLLYGALGALWTLTAFLGGAVVGWQGTAITAVRKTEEAERRSFDAEQQSFEEMLRYNMDTAYGVSGEEGERE